MQLKKRPWGGNEGLKNGIIQPATGAVPHGPRPPNTKKGSVHVDTEPFGPRQTPKLWQREQIADGEIGIVAKHELLAAGGFDHGPVDVQA